MERMRLFTILIAGLPGVCAEGTDGKQAPRAMVHPRVAMLGTRPPEHAHASVSMSHDRATGEGHASTYIPHEQPSDDPWMAGPAEALGEGIEHCGAWVRDGYESIQVNVDARGCNIVGDAANEPSIAVDPTDPRKIVIGWRQFDTVESNFRQAGWGYSHDAGYSWTFPGTLDPGAFGSDPVLAADADGRFYYLTIAYDQTRVFRSVNGGLSWAQRAVLATWLIDKPWMAIDRTDGMGRGNIYVGAEWGGLHRSTDAGASFVRPGVAVPRYPTMSVGVDGELFVAGEPREFRRSSNAQDSSQVPMFDIHSSFDLGGGTILGAYPNIGGGTGQLWVAADHSEGRARGNVYVLGSVWAGVDDLLDVMFARSVDGGITWSEKKRVNDDAEDNGAYHWFGMISVAPDGRLDAVWNDTRNTGDPTVSELFYAYSVDAGETWSANVPVSPSFGSWVGLPHGSAKLGDYYHMISDNLGVNVAYAATFNGEQDIYFLRIGPWDCNGNGIDDEIDIADPSSRDFNHNGVPDECEYRGDYDGDGFTTLDDFARFWMCLTGPVPPHPPLGPGCRLFDLDPDDDVDLADLANFQRAFNGP